MAEEKKNETATQTTPVVQPVTANDPMLPLMQKMMDTLQTIQDKASAPVAQVESGDPVANPVVSEMMKTLKAMQERDRKDPVSPNMDIFKAGKDHYFVDSEGNKFVNDKEDRDGTRKIIGHVSDKKAKA